jgi:hypothetical protein
MLMGRSMENQFRMIHFHQGIDPGGIANRAYHHLQIQAGVEPLQLHLDIIGIVFVDIQDHQLSGIGPGDLSAKFTADTAAATGDHNHFS